MSQFRPVARMGGRKEMARQGQFRATVNHAFVAKPPPTPSREGRCKGNDNSCKAYAAKGTEYCAGHLRSLGLLEEVTDEARSVDHSDSDAAGS